MPANSNAQAGHEFANPAVVVCATRPATPGGATSSSGMTSKTKETAKLSHDDSVKADDVPARPCHTRTAAFNPPVRSNVGLHNLGVEDDMESIAERNTQEMLLFEYGS